MKIKILFLLLTVKIFAQQPERISSNEIYHQVQKLNFLGSVLYVAAHPDDENTKLISYFANHVNANTAYISLTRGDGGQNLIGPELSEQLGVIRTQELLKARSIDKGKQLFTRAFDFGFSKTPDETFQIWDKKEVLADLIQAIKTFRPDVIINRFDHRTPGTTHGHHTASAILSLEAFDLVKNSTNSPKRLFYNTSPWAFANQEEFEKADKSNHVKIESNIFYPTFGKNNSEIAALSRSQHKCQGFGATGNRQSDIEYLEIIKGDLPQNKSNIFEGINTTWTRIPEGNQIGEILLKIENNFNFINPSSHISDLIKAYQLIENIKDDYWRELKSEQIKKIIIACSGLYFEAVTNKEIISKSEDFNVTLEVTKRSEFPIKIQKIELFNKIIASEIKLENYKPNFTILNKINVPENSEFSNPYWLNNNIENGLFVVNNPEIRNLPEINNTFPVVFTLQFGDVIIPFTKNLNYKFNCPENGETFRPFVIVPDVTLAFKNEVLVFADDKPKEIIVRIKAQKNNISGKVKIKTNQNWKVSPSEISFSIDKKNEETEVKFMVSPPKQSDKITLEVLAEVNGRNNNQNFIEIDYNHIPKQTILKTAKTDLIKLDIKKSDKKIAYIMGSSDKIPEGLQQIGYDVSIINSNEISPERLNQFQVVILGIRAYNTDENLKHKSKVLKEYTQNGGTVIMQYITSGFRSSNDISDFTPYHLKIGRERVTEENAAVNFLNKNHSVLNTPNKITKSDFDNWIQERGLYFAENWASEFEPILEMNDTNESPKKGSLLIAKYGKGYFVYTGISFFRQIPNAVPGAYKLLVNLIEL